MSPTGGKEYSWLINAYGNIEASYITNAAELQPVINLKSNTTIEGLGTSDSPWEVQ